MNEYIVQRLAEAYKLTPETLYLDAVNASGRATAIDGFTALSDIARRDHAGAALGRIHAANNSGMRDDIGSLFAISDADEFRDFRAISPETIVKFCLSILSYRDLEDLCTDESVTRSVTRTQTGCDSFGRPVYKVRKLRRHIEPEHVPFARLLLDCAHESAERKGPRLAKFASYLFKEFSVLGVTNGKA